MRLTKLIHTGAVQDDMRHVIRALNFAELVVPFAAITADTGAVIGAALTPYGGVMIDRSIFRMLLPDSRWVVYAAGWAQSDGTNALTVSLRYQKDDTTTVLLGSVSTTSAGAVKLSMGPFDVFGTLGVPAGETIPCIRLFAQKTVGANGQLYAPWQVILRLLPAKQ